MCNSTMVIKLVILSVFIVTLGGVNSYFLLNIICLIFFVLLLKVNTEFPFTSLFYFINLYLFSSPVRSIISVCYDFLLNKTFWWDYYIIYFINER